MKRTFNHDRAYQRRFTWLWNHPFEEAQDEVRITLGGELDAASAPQFKEAVEKAATVKPKRLVLFMQQLTSSRAPGCGS